MQKKSQRILTINIVCTALFSAMAVVLMNVETALPLFPEFLKFDFSEIPVLVGSFSLGPIYGVIIELFKNLLHILTMGSSTAYIGELGNFVAGSVFVFTAGMIYSRHRTRKGAIIGMIIATIFLGLFAIPFNYFVTMPMYGINSGRLTMALTVFAPFNLIKGVIISFITFWIYKPLSTLINRIRNKQ